MPATRIPGATTAPELDGYLAVPPVGEGPWPGVVVVHEIFGLTDDARQQADRLAAAGYLAVVPDLYTAGGALKCVRATIEAVTRAEGPAFGDLEATLAPRGFAASAPNYGPLPKADLTSVLRGACPVVASYGARDRGLPGAAAKIEQALGELGVEYDVKDYPDAGHSFMNRHNAGPLNVLARMAGIGYHHPSAEDAWGRILRFFDAHLRSAPQA
jgi:carboxymethylenebutenolidase